MLLGHGPGVSGAYPALVARTGMAWHGAILLDEISTDTFQHNCVLYIFAYHVMCMCAPGHVRAVHRMGLHICVLYVYVRPKSGNLNDMLVAPRRKSNILD